jgi:hypothetical protein
VSPLDPSGIPWGEIRPGWVRDYPPYLMNAASASLAASDVGACLYVTGGQLGFSGEALSGVDASCAQDDGFLGSPLPGRGTRTAPPMAIPPAVVTRGNRFYVFASGISLQVADIDPPTGRPLRWR